MRWLRPDVSASVMRRPGPDAPASMRPAFGAYPDALPGPEKTVRDRGLARRSHLAQCGSDDQGPSSPKQPGCAGYDRAAELLASPGTVVFVFGLSVP